MSLAFSNVRASENFKSEKNFQGIDVYNPGKYVGMDKEHWTYW